MQVGDADVHQDWLANLERNVLHVVVRHGTVAAEGDDGIKCELFAAAAAPEDFEFQG